MLAAPGFYPTPHSKALFVENFHAPNFVAGGLKALYIFNGDMHFRIEGYGFLPFFQTLRGPDYKAVEAMNSLERSPSRVWPPWYTRPVSDRPV